MISLDVVFLPTFMLIWFDYNAICDIHPDNINLFISNVVSIHLLLSFCLYFNCLKFNEVFYKEIRKAPLKSSPSVSIAEIKKLLLENYFNYKLIEALMLMIFLF